MKDIQGCYIIINETKSTDDKLYVKIGKSKHCNKRFKEISSSYRFNGSLDKLFVFTIIPCKRYSLMEKHLHQILASKRICGEYFLVTEEELNNALFRLDLSYYNKEV